jgi:hypothetical protein
VYEYAFGRISHSKKQHVLGGFCVLPSDSCIRQSSDIHCFFMKVMESEVIPHYDTHRKYVLHVNYGLKLSPLKVGS